MNARCLMSLACVTVAYPAAAYANKPPVKVEVIVDGEDEQDFFEDEEPAPKKKSVRERADDAFDEVEASEGVQIRTTRRKKKSRAQTDNSSTQVVNVIVQGSSQQDAKNEAKNETSVKNETKTSTEPTATTQGPPAPDDCNCKVQTRRRLRRAWWRVPNHVQRGDFMIGMSGGWSSAGGLFGMRLEGMASQSLGIQLKFHATGFENEDLDRDGFSNFVTDDNWGVGEIDSRDVTRGFAHLTDLTLAWHIFNTSRFDLHPTIGVSHFGYDIEFRTGPSQAGGSALLRVGLGLNYHWRRIFAGVDVGWYPYEFVRYESVPDGDGDRDTRKRRIEDRFNEHRLLTTAHVGFRF